MQARLNIAPRSQSPRLGAMTLRRRAMAGQAIAANGNPLSGASASIPSTTTEHQQVPTSITKKHKRQLCYRRRAANVGGREMVLGRIFDGRVKCGYTSSHALRGYPLDRHFFPQSVLCFHSGFHGDTTVETDANVASVGFRPVPGVITPVRSVNSADFMSHKHEAAMVSREPKAILVKLALSPQP